MYIYCGYIIPFESVTTAQLNHYESAAVAKLKLMITSVKCCLQRTSDQRNRAQLQTGLLQALSKLLVAGLHLGRKELFFKRLSRTTVADRLIHNI